MTLRFALRFRNYGFFLLLFFAMSACQQTPSSSASSTPFKEGHYTSYQNKSAPHKTIAIVPYGLVILDSASQLKVLDSLQGDKTLMALDGKARFEFTGNSRPVELHTGMMKLYFSNVIFNINAYQQSPGQSLKVHEGSLIATKSYKSDFPNTDTIHRGQMILINKDIDLMEKETFDTTKQDMQTP